MKKIFPVLALLVLVVALSGCTGDQWSTNKTFSGNGLTFVYPGTWSNEDPNQFGTTQNTTSIASVGNSEYGFVVNSIAVPQVVQSNSDLFLQTLTPTISNYPNATLVSTKNITLDGVQGVQVNYNDVKGLSSGDTILSFNVWIKNSKAWMAVYGSKTNDTATLDRILSTVQTT
jgi:hypothetical protein